MTPDQIAKNGSEHAIQSALFAWAAVAENHGFEVADLWVETNDAKAFLTSKKQAFLNFVGFMPFRTGAVVATTKSRAKYAAVK